MHRPQYWVIDALDECVGYAEFFTLLSKVESAFPLRILVTSRIVPEIQSGFSRFGRNAVSVEINLQDSMRDIEAYIQNRIEDLPSDGSQEKQDLANKILAKSCGCFLWVHLVLHELSSVYTDNSIWIVLDEIPEGMVPFYERTLEIMARNKRDVDLAKAILLWTVYSIRPLRTFELREALQLDVGANVLNIKKAIEGLCGQLVHVDKNDTVQVVHPTAREFLIGNSTSEYAIPEQKAHERLSLICLRYLSSHDMRPPRNRMLSNAPRREVSMFREYACTAFSEHVFSAFSGADSVLSALDLFFRTNVRSWIEHIAHKETLYHIIRAAKNLRGYLGRRAKCLSPLGSQGVTVDAWVTDLTRLVVKFGVALTTVSSAIYFLIPPLCPTNSAIFKQFARSADGLVLEGVKRTFWEDCISWTHFSHAARSLASGDKAYAAGMTNGDIGIYDHGSCQWDRTIQHHENIDILKFDNSGHCLASAGIQSIKLWDTNGTLLWTRRLKSRCIELNFQINCLTSFSMYGDLIDRDLKTGEIVGDPRRYQYVEPDDGSGKAEVRSPSTSSISPDLQIVALATNKTYVCLWSLENSDIIGWCSTPGGDGVVLVKFNPNPQINIIAVGYNTSLIAIFDPWSQEMIQSTRTGNRSSPVASLASSPDGRTLATVDCKGTMQIWDFETLALLYQIKSSDFGSRIINFSPNGLRIMDLMGSKLRVWEPAVLIRKTVEEAISVSDTANRSAIEGQNESKVPQEITAVVSHPNLPIVFVGKYNGSVAAYSSRTGKKDVTYYVHDNDAFVTAIAISPHNILASGDVDGNVQLWQLMKTPTRSLRTISLLLKTSAKRCIRQILISPGGDSVLLSTRISNSVFSLRTGMCTGSFDQSPIDADTWQWLVRTEAQSELLLIFRDKVLRYSWDDLPHLSNPQVFILPPDCQQCMIDTEITSAILDTARKNLVITFEQYHYEIATKAIFILSVGNVLSSPLTTPSATATQPIMLTSNLTHPDLRDCVEHLLGFWDSRLLFIDKKSWLSSIDLEMEMSNGKRQRYTRHFFVPNDFVAKEPRVLPIVSRDKDAIFAMEGELAVVRNGLKFQSVPREFWTTPITIGSQHA